MLNLIFATTVQSNISMQHCDCLALCEDCSASMGSKLHLMPQADCQ